MKIGAESVDKLSSDLIQRDLKRIKRNEDDSSRMDSEDKVELSSQALDLKAMEAKVNSQSDVRTELVEKIKLKVDNGTYQISNERIAEQLIDEAMGK